jgi:hypothetical protein
VRIKELVPQESAGSNKPNTLNGDMARPPAQPTIKEVEYVTQYKDRKN